MSSNSSSSARLSGLASILVLLSGCGGWGGLGQARMAGDCAAGDTNCKRRTLDAPIAVGAVVRPDLVFELRGSAAPSLHFDTADPTVLVAKQGAILGKSPGISALLLTTDDGTVLDFFHVWVREATGIRLSMVQAGATEAIRRKVELLAGESVRLLATPTAEGQDLAGESVQEWTIDPPIAVLLEEGRDDSRRLVAMDPGAATLTVRSLGKSVELGIVVRPKPGAVSPVAGERKETP